MEPTVQATGRASSRLWLRVVGVGVLAALLVGGVWWAWSSSTAGRGGPRPLRVVASGDTAGWIEPCGCTANQSGGLARRATYVNGLRHSGDVVLLDAGGAPGGVSDYDRLKFRAILRGEVAMGIAAHNVGRAEAALGADELRRLAADTAAPFVSTNVRGGDDQLLAPPLRILDVGGRRIAVLGVLAPALSSAGLKATDPRSAILETLRGAKGTYDLAIVLAYLPTAELEALAADMPEIDLVIGGPTGQTIAPRKLGPTWLVAVTNKAKFVALFDIPPRGGDRAWEAAIIEMDTKLKDDPDQKANLEAYVRDLAAHDFSASQTSFAPALPAVPADYQVVGTASCRACHAAECTVWDGTAHAHAWRTLLDRNRQFDSLCQQCHTTAYGLPGGFASVSLSPQRTDVGCESCHGPSAAHAAHPEKKTAFAASDQCRHCHDHENSPKFDFASYWERIKHGG